jgi:hypothetical protein
VTGNLPHVLTLRASRVCLWVQLSTESRPRPFQISRSVESIGSRCETRQSHFYRLAIPRAAAHRGQQRVRVQALTALGGRRCRSRNSGFHKADTHLLVLYRDAIQAVPPLL